MINKIYYNNPKNYSVNEVLNATSVALAFEFFSSKQEQFLIEDLQKITGKTVILTDELYDPSWTTAILLKEYNGPRARYKFNIGFQNYMTVGTILNETLNWINTNAYVNESTGLKIKINFDYKQLQVLNTISNMNTGKLLLKLDETYIHKFFPEAAKSPYCLSIKKLIPINEFSVSDPIISHINTDFFIPTDTYYGVDLTEQKWGTLIYNYTIGVKYPEKTKEINELLYYFVITSFNCLNEQGYSEDEDKEFKRLTEDYRKLRRGFYDPQYFLNEFKDIKISVNLIGNSQTVISFWDKIRNPLLNLMMETEFKKGYINLDTEDQRFQVKNAELFGVKVKDIDVTKSNLSGCILENCNLYHTKVEGSQLFLGIVVGSCEVKESKLTQVRVDRENKIHKCYIINAGEVVNCRVTESVIRNATPGKEFKLDEHTIVVELKDKLGPPMMTGLDIKEIRDYKWIKQLGHPVEGEQRDIVHVFGNQYKDKW